MSKATFLNPYNVFLYVLGHNKQHVSSFNYGKIQTTGAVLVAISIPIFTSQLEKAREATDLANIRAAYAECSASCLSGAATDNSVTVTDSNGKITATKTVGLKQQKANWEGNATPEIGGVKLKNTIAVGTGVTVTVTDDGVPTFKQGDQDLKFTE